MAHQPNHPTPISTSKEGPDNPGPFLVSETELQRINHFRIALSPALCKSKLRSDDPAGSGRKATVNSLFVSQEVLRSFGIHTEPTVFLLFTGSTRNGPNAHI